MMTDFGRLTRSCLGLAAFSLILGVQAKASSLIYSFDKFMGGGHQPCSAGPVEFAMGHGTTLFDPLIVGHGLRFWESGDSGSINISSFNDPGFGSLATGLTDGMDDYLFLLDNPSGCPGFGGNIAMESFWLKGSPDLVGNSIESISLIVHDIAIEQQGTLVTWQADITYEFWGTPLPEPASLALLALPLVLSRRRCSRLMTENCNR